MPEENILQRNIINALKLENLPDTEKVELLDEMSQLVQDRVILRLVKDLSKEDVKEFNKIKEDDQGGQLNFLHNKFPNLLNIINKEIKVVRKKSIERSKDSCHLQPPLQLLFGIYLCF